jgi:nitroimidazol reductase NimA-like FMN-containing flavoprotein (pyridoxamine 5'-phosphate oxidase superfamily)
MSEAQRPTVSRPNIPAIYGIPKHKKNLLPWSHVSERMAAATHFWVSTVSPDNHPHATPVDGLWVNDRLYFGGSAETRRSRNLASNAQVCIHLESGTDVVILHGEARELRDPDEALVTSLIEASAQKYGYAPKPEDFAHGGTYEFRPRTVFAWSHGMADATRWQFPTT